MNSEANFLVPSSATWRGTVGIGLKPAQLPGYLHSVSLAAWRPSFIVLHNTFNPTLTDTHRKGFGFWHSAESTQRLKNLTGFYRGLKPAWLGGPHAFVADDFIWLFTPLWKQGTHSPSWNAMSWGIEMVGDYSAEPFSSAVRDNAVALLAALYAWRGMEPTDKTLRFHKEDPRTGHKDCPGSNVSKTDLLARVHHKMVIDANGEHTNPPLTS